MYRVLIAVLILVTAAFPQSSKRHHKHAATPATPQMPSAKQSDQMKKMVETFAGMWKTTATVEKSEFFSPVAGTAVGRSDFRSGPAGNSLIERARSHGVMGAFAGMGVFWWDTQASVYRGLWCDNLAPDGCDALGTGHWDGNTLTFTSDMDMGQTKMHMKETYSDITTDSFTFTMESAVGDAPMAKMMIIKYERETPKSAATAPTTPATDTKPQ